MKQSWCILIVQLKQPVIVVQFPHLHGNIPAASVDKELVTKEQINMTKVDTTQHMTNSSLKHSNAEMIKTCA